MMMRAVDEGQKKKKKNKKRKRKRRRKHKKRSQREGYSRDGSKIVFFLMLQEIVNRLRQKKSDSEHPRKEKGKKEKKKKRKKKKERREKEKKEKKDRNYNKKQKKTKKAKKGLPKRQKWTTWERTLLPRKYWWGALECVVFLGAKCLFWMWLFPRQNERATCEGTARGLRETWFWGREIIIL